MFLSQRSLETEYFDDPGRNLSEVRRAYRDLRRINDFLNFTRPFVSTLPRLLGRERCRHLTFLDLGAGDGLFGELMSRWAARRTWSWHFTNLDLNATALDSGRNGCKVIGSVLAVPFADARFDVVVASQMTHHLNREADLVQHFREAWRVARHAVIVSDLHRNAGLAGLTWLAMRVMCCSPALQRDAVISVRRGFRAAEWRALAAQAGMKGARVWLYAGMRLMLEAHKTRD